MSVETIRSAIGTLLATVSGIGVVNEEIPFGKDEAFFREHFCDSAGKVNGWTVSVVPATPGYGMGYIDHTYVVTIRGILQVENAERSRATAEVLCESLETVFHRSIANRRLPESSTDTVDWTEAEAPPAIQEAKVRAASGEILCHVITYQFRAHAKEALAA